MGKNGATCRGSRERRGRGGDGGEGEGERWVLEGKWKENGRKKEDKRYGEGVKLSRYLQFH